MDTRPACLAFMSAACLAAPAAHAQPECCDACLYLAITSQSLAFGEDASATGAQSVALGRWSYAAATDTLAFGLESRALNVGDVAIGGGWASGRTSLALGPSSATGILSSAIGMSAVASGDFSMALGESRATGNSSYAIGGMGVASGDFSLSLAEGYAVGQYSIAVDGESVGDYAVTLGRYSLAEGEKSVAIGYMAYAPAEDSIALGAGGNEFVRKDGSRSSSEKSPLDPVFMVGSGRYDPPTVIPGDLHNALTIFRDGDTHINGVVRVMPGGDIPMGTFTSKPEGVQFP